MTITITKMCKAPSVYNIFRSSTRHRCVTLIKLVHIIYVQYYLICIKSHFQHVITDEPNKLICKRLSVLRNNLSRIEILIRLHIQEFQAIRQHEEIIFKRKPCTIVNIHVCTSYTLMLHQYIHQLVRPFHVQFLFKVYLCACISV